MLMLETFDFRPILQENRLNSYRAAAKADETTGVAQPKHSSGCKLAHVI